MPDALLLHGLGRTYRAMNKLAKALKDRGYTINNISYPSTRRPIAWQAENIVAPAINALTQIQPVHIVTHSLGGILIRQYLQDHQLPAGSRIVMLAPPNHGSEVADHLKHWKIFQWILGPCLQQLGTDNRSVPNQLKPVNADIGIITGDKSVYPPVSWWIPGENDGLVSAESARLNEMQDFMVISASHGFIMNKPETIRQVLQFLKTGRFNST